MHPLGNRLVSALVAILFVLGFVGCALICSADDCCDESAPCVCQSLALPVPVALGDGAPLTVNPFVALDERLKLPLFVADIFNPPKV